MPQYDVAFAEKLSQVANMVLADGIEEVEAKRTVIYLSLLSCEIGLKAMLEKAGKPVAEIRSRSHNLGDLLLDLDQCVVKSEVVPGQLRVVPASRLRGKTLKYGEAEVTIGAVMSTETDKTSKYPNEVRYGDRLRHYPPSVMAQMAAAIVTFARENWSGLCTK